MYSINLHRILEYLGDGSLPLRNPDFLYKSQIEKNGRNNVAKAFVLSNHWDVPLQKFQQ